MMTSRKSSTWNSGVNNTILVVLFGSKETKVREISTNSFELGKGVSTSLNSYRYITSMTA